LTEESLYSISTNLSIDLNGKVNEKSEETFLRPVAHLELLEGSSEINQKPKFMIGRMQRRASSVSSSSSSVVSSTKTITISHDDVVDKKPTIVAKTIERKEPACQSSRSSRSSISDFSLVKETILQKKIVDQKNESSSYSSSVISSVSNSRTNRFSEAQTSNNRVKSAKITLTRQALDQHNRNDENN
jgi:hypothetical protein